MIPTPLTPAASFEPSASCPHTERIAGAALVIDPEALEGRLMAEAPAAKRIRHSGEFLNAGLGVEAGSLHKGANHTKLG